MKDEITVSISCTTYNHSKYIRECLDGFLMQQCNFKFEVLIHDDASTDDTQEIIKEYQAKYPEIIKPILRKINLYSQGEREFNARFNVSRAEGKYIAMCEGDDYWIDPLKLQKQVSFLEANPTCSLVFTGCEIHKSNGEKKTIQYKINHLIDVNEYLTNSYFMATASLLFKKEVFSEAKSEEWMSKAFAGDFILRYKALTIGKIGYVDSIAVVYNKGTEGSWSNRKLTEAVIAKEYNDNVLALQYVKNHIPTLSQEVYNFKMERLNDAVFYKQALRRGGVRGLLYLIKNYNLRMSFYIGAYVKYLYTKR